MLGEIHEGTGVGDESRADQFSHQNREIRGDRHHPVLDVIVKLTSERQMDEPDKYKPQKHQIAVPVHSFSVKLFFPEIEGAGMAAAQKRSMTYAFTHVNEFSPTPQS